LPTTNNQQPTKPFEPLNKFILRKPLLFKFLALLLHYQAYPIGTLYFLNLVSRIYSQYSLRIVKNQTLQVIQLNLNVKRHIFRSLVALLSLMMSSYVMAVLSTQTNRVINGHKPYFTLDGGVTAVNASNELLSITLSDGRTILALEDTSSADDPIVLPSSTDTFSHIQSLIPLPSAGNKNYPSVTLDTLISDPYYYWADSDDDGNAKASGELKVKWQNYKNVDITQRVKNNLDTILDPCEAPYKLTLSSTDVLLSTEYGVPSESHLKGDSHSYYIKPKPNENVASVCYAQPNIWIDSTTSNHFADLDGPDWRAGEGFIPQDINNPVKNFPSTGANGLFFKIKVEGITAQQIIQFNGQTVQPESGQGVILKLSAEGNKNNVVKIMLEGPDQFSRDRTFIPSVFKLYADNDKKRLLYSFKLARWYINTTKDRGKFTRQEAINFCGDLRYNYRLAGVSDLTNANSTRDLGGWTRGLPDRDHTFDHYRRQLSYHNGRMWIGGLFNEWGYVSAWGGRYWTINSNRMSRWGDEKYYHVINYSGRIEFDTGNDSKVACVTP
jgi:hypothetical protein